MQLKVDGIPLMKNKKTLVGVKLVRWNNLMAMISSLGGVQAKVLERLPDLLSGHLSQMVRQDRGIGDIMARRFEQAFGTEAGSMDIPDWGRVAPALKPKIAYRYIKLHADFDGDKLDTLAEGERIPFQSEDPGAYALRIVGDWARPRIQHYELVVVEPNQTPESGDLILVTLKNKKSHLFILMHKREQFIRVCQLADHSSSTTIPAQQIENLAVVSTIILHTRKPA
jgi:hypothetical protein